MDDEQLQIERTIERCRRLASEITDDELRRSLNELADEYEARLERRGEGFMLQPSRSNS